MGGQPATDSLVELGRVIIIGGGCYGSFYTRQLEQARARGRARYSRILVIDRNPECQVARELPPDADRELVVADWSAFLDQYLAGRRPGCQPGPGDVIVPSPLMPHLMYQWLLARARERWPERRIATAPISLEPGTPYDAVAPDHTRYLSFADWICPTHCIEPARCPVIRGPRTWEMSETITRLAERLNRERPTPPPVLLRCRHTVFAVGTFGVDEVLEGDRCIAEVGATGEPAQVLVGTISACHGALNLMRLE